MKFAEIPATAKAMMRPALLAATIPLTVRSRVDMAFLAMDVPWAVPVQDSVMGMIYYAQYGERS